MRASFSRGVAIAVLLALATGSSASAQASPDAPPPRFGPLAPGLSAQRARGASGPAPNASACDLPDEYDFRVLDGIDFRPAAYTLGESAAHLAVSGPLVFWSDAGETAAISWADFEAQTFGPLVGRLGGFLQPVIAGGRIFWTEVRAGIPTGRVLLRRAGLDGQGLTTIGEWTALVDTPAEMVADDESVYLVTRTVSPNVYTLRRVPQNGGPSATLATFGDQPFGLAVDDSFVYWTEQGYGQPVGNGSMLKRVPKTGGTAELLLDGFPFPRPGLLRVGDHVVFAQADGMGNQRIVRVPVGGGPPVVLVEIENDPQFTKTIRRLVRDDTRVFWLDSTALRSAPLIGGALQTLVDGIPYQQANGLASDGTHVLWTESRPFTDGFQGVLRRIPVTGGVSEDLAGGLDAPGVLLLGPADDVFWPEPGLLRRLPLPGGAPATVLSGASGNFIDMVTDHTYLYFLDGGRLRRVPFTGGHPESLAPFGGGVSNTNIATDGTYVFSGSRMFAGVFRVSVAGGGVVSLSSGTSPGAAVDVGGDSAFWIEHIGKVKRVPKAGGSTSTIYQVPNFLDHLVADDEWVYLDSGRKIRHDGSDETLSGCGGRLAKTADAIVCGGGGGVARAPKGGVGRSVISGLPFDSLFPDAVAGDDAGQVYFTNVVNGWVVRGMPFTPDLGAFRFRLNSMSVPESGRQARVTVLREGDLSRQAAVSYVSSDATARAGDDYSAVAGRLSFPPGVGSATFTVPILEDTRADGSEGVLLQLLDPEGCFHLGIADTAVLTIADNDQAGTVQLSAAAYAVDEPGPFATITVLRSGGAASDVTVDYATADGTAQAGVHYLPVSGTLTFARGISRQSFTIPILDDGVVDANKTVHIALSDASGGGTLGVLSQAFLTIREDNPVVQFGEAATSVPESAAKAVINVRRFGPALAPAAVAYSTSDGTALAGVSYLPAAGVLAFPPGVTTQSFDVPILNDTAQEGSQSVMLTLSSPSGGTALGQIDTAVLIIGDNDQAGSVSFSVSTYRIAASSDSARVAVRRASGLASGATVDYRTSDGTAQGGVHYASTAGTLSFGAGVGEQSFTVPILGLASPSSDLTAHLALDAPGGGAILGSLHEATLLIESADPKLSFSAPVFAVNEEGPRASITVRRSGPKGGKVGVNYATSDGTASAGVDYQETGGTLVFLPNVTQQTFSVPVSASDEVEEHETVNLALRDPTGGAALGALPAAVLEIRTDEPRIRFGLAASSVAESAPRATISVRRGPPTNRASSVSFSTGDGTALAGLDYEAVAGDLQFPPGVASRTFAVPILNDTLQQGRHTVNLFLANPVNALLGPPTEAELTLQDNDVAGKVRFSGSEAAASESRGAAVVTVLRTGGAASGATVHFATSDGSALAGTQYEATSGTLTFGASETTKAFTIPLFDDGGATGNRSFTVTLSEPEGGLSLTSPATVKVWIVDRGAH